MREAHDLIVLDLLCIREVAEVALESTVCEHFVNRIHFYKAVTSKVQDMGTLEVCEVLAVEKVFCYTLDERNVNSEEVRLSDDGIEVCDFNLIRKFVHVECVWIRFVCNNAHVLPTSVVSNENTDLAKADNAKGLASKFRTGKLLLAAFNSLSHVRVIYVESLDPVCSLTNVTNSHTENGHNKFSNCVCVCTWSVEYANTLCRSLVDCDVVHTGTGTGNSKEAIKIVGINLCRTHKDCIRIFDAVRNLIVLSEKVKTLLGNVVHSLNSCHDLFLIVMLF